MRMLEIAIRMLVREPLFWLLHPVLFVRVAKGTVMEMERRGMW